MVNLHNQCGRVHSSAAEAISKAKTLMRMGVARARRLEPLDDIRVDVRQTQVVGDCVIRESGCFCRFTLLVDRSQEPLFDFFLLVFF